MKFLAVTIKELKLLLRDPANLLLLFLLPAVFILVLSIALQGAFASPDSRDKIDVLVVNGDSGDFGKDLVAALNEKGHFRAVTEVDRKPLTREQCDRLISAGAYPVALYIPDHMKDGITFEEKQTLELVVDPTFSKEVTLALKGGVKEFVHLSMLAGKMIEADKKGEAIDTLSDRIDEVKDKAKECEADFDDLVKRIKRRLPPKKKKKSEDKEKDDDDDEDKDDEVDVAVETIQKKDIDETVAVIDKSGVEIAERFAYGGGGESSESPNSVQQNVPGWTIFALFWIAQILMINILYERQSGAFKRVMVSPISFPAYIVAKTLPFGLINLLQALAMFGLGVHILPLLGCPELTLTNIPALALLTVAISFTAIGFGLMMASVSKTIFLSASVSATVLIIMTAVGGIMVPRFIMPETMQKMTLFVPHGWALEGYLNIIVRHQSTMEILPHVGALLAFGVGFFGFAIVRMHRLNRG